MDARVEVKQIPERHRFEIFMDDERVGLLIYRDQGVVRSFDHTEIDPAHERRGLAATLVRTALDAARAEGLRVVPACSYVAAFIERNPEYADLVAA
ncbi:MAG TPA: GNAT family N-acetyltransferase [Mycobacteriales bacterium]|nr:GNAT family N-acetyltransferase [Mycobacteriales bacterium]